ncbi:MAG: hypothetical protein GY862_37550 [Gammaproteobacteria bacterium]|nr:hypothetical protein [Gammaproteobacteria bacterium]
MTATPITPEIPPGFSALLTIQGEEADRHEIRAESLDAVLSVLQKAAYLLATAKSCPKIGKRLNLSRDMRKRFSLHCGIPLAGSYALPLSESSPEMLLLEEIQQIWVALSKQNGDALTRLLPIDVAERVLNAIKKILSWRFDGLSFSLQTRAIPEPAILTCQASPFIKDYLKPIISEAMMITGKLGKVNLDSRHISIIYPPTRQQIGLFYDLDNETVIRTAIVNREPIQLTGRFELDSADNPKKLIKILRIEPLDLSPIQISDIKNISVCMREELVLKPFLDEDSREYLCVEEPALGLNAFALNREQLFDEIQEQLAMLWKEYACAANEELDVEAQKLKANLLARMEARHAKA